MSDDRPIGIFDSGVGGLTVVQKMSELLPHEKIIYFGDTARVPYGNKSRETVMRFSEEIVSFLLNFDVKLIVIACNTSSSLCERELGRRFGIPVIGVVEPGVYEALKLSREKRIGVIGTPATISSNVYRDSIKKIEKGAFVIQKSCPLFVPLVENGHLNDKITYEIAGMYLSPLFKKKIDTLILGCTHYPLLKGVIENIADRRMELVDSSMAVAKYVKNILLKKSIMARGKKIMSGCREKKDRFFVSDDPKGFMKSALLFLGRRIEAEKKVLP